MTGPTQQPTHCHLLTPPGTGAIAVIRVCGPQAVNVVAELFHPARPSNRPLPDPQQPHRLCYGQWIDGGETVDDVIVCAGTDLQGRMRVDVNTHGGVRVVQRVLMSLGSRGVALASADAGQCHAWPTEHQIEAEAVAAVSGALTRRAVGFLVHQRSVLPGYLAELADRAPADPAGVRQCLQRLLDDAPGCRYLVDGATVAIVGPPNAGKSTLANRLFGTPMAIVSSTPGTTRDWVAEPTAIQGIPVTLVDTAGVGAAAGPAEEQAVRRAITSWADADLGLLVLDGAAPWPDDFFARVAAELPGRNLILVMSKVDLPQRWGPQKLPEPWRGSAVAVSAETGSGMASLDERVVAALSLKGRCDSAPGLFTERQRRVVAELLTGPAGAADRLAVGIRHDLIGQPREAGRAAGYNRGAGLAGR